MGFLTTIAVLALLGGVLIGYIIAPQLKEANRNDDLVIRPKKRR